MNKEKIYNLLIFILIFFSILSIILLNPLDSLDEIWNYNFARNIANGLVPYKDFNIVTTPLLSFICGIVLKVVCDQLIVMRILAALLCSGIIFAVYRIFSLLNIKKELSIIGTFFVGYILKDIFCIDYNYASLLICLEIIYKEIKFYKTDNIFIKEDKKTDILLGVLAGLAIITKQTSGIFISIAMLGNKILFVKNKEDFITCIKSCFYRVIGIAIPTLCFVLYLLINNAFGDFINYAILGIKEFNNIIPYKTLINKDLTGFLATLVPIAIIYIWIKAIVFEKDKKLYIFLVYGLAIFIICFPISDKIHFIISVMPIIIAILYEINKLVEKLYELNKIKTLKLIIKFIVLLLQNIVILFLIYYGIFNFNKYLKNKESFSTLNHYRYIPINSELQSNIKVVDKFIESNGDVKMLDSCAAVYMIPLERYNKNYDMINKGNLGLAGENKIIQEISKSNNTKYLVLNDEYTLNWQTPIKIINYTKENKKKSGTVRIYDVYE